MSLRVINRVIQACSVKYEEENESEINGQALNVKSVMKRDPICLVFRLCVLYQKEKSIGNNSYRLHSIERIFQWHLENEEIADFLHSHFEIVYSFQWH